MSNAELDRIGRLADPEYLKLLNRANACGQRLFEERAKLDLLDAQMTQMQLAKNLERSAYLDLVRQIAVAHRTMSELFGDLLTALAGIPE